MRSYSVIHYQRYVCVNAVEQQAGDPAGENTPINLQNFNIDRLFCQSKRQGIYSPASKCERILLVCGWFSIPAWEAERVFPFQAPQ